MKKLPKLNQLLDSKKLYHGLLHVTLVILTAKVIVLAGQVRELKDRPQRRLEPMKIGDSFSWDGLSPLNPNFELDLSAPQLVLVFSTTCKFCTQNLPWWDKLASEMSDRSVPIVGISVHSREKTYEYAQANGMDIPILYARNGRAFLKDNKLRGVPTTLLVNQQSQVEGVWRGLLSETKIGQIVDQTSSDTFSMNLGASD